jgi:hypothetical protein
MASETSSGQAGACQAAQTPMSGLVVAQSEHGAVDTRRMRPADNPFPVTNTNLSACFNNLQFSLFFQKIQIIPRRFPAQLD